MTRYNIEGEINNYEDYLDIQIKRSISKWRSKTFKNNRKEFFDLVSTIYKFTGKKKTILCLGIRNGNEYFAFKESPEFSESEMWGIDICPHVVNVGPNCHCQDFSNLPKGWEDKFEMAYSNSLDHALHADETLLEWHRVVKKDGYIILVLSGARVCATDIYSFNLEEAKKIIPLDKFEIVWEEELSTGCNLLLKVKK